MRLSFSPFAHNCHNTENITVVHTPTRPFKAYSEVMWSLHIRSEHSPRYGFPFALIASIRKWVSIRIAVHIVAPQTLKIIYFMHSLSVRELHATKCWFYFYNCVRQYGLFKVLSGIHTTFAYILICVRGLFDNSVSLFGSLPKFARSH